MHVFSVTVCVYKCVHVPVGLRPCVVARCCVHVCECFHVCVCAWVGAYVRSLDKSVRFLSPRARTDDSENLWAREGYVFTGGRVWSVLLDERSVREVNLVLRVISCPSRAFQESRPEREGSLRVHWEKVLGPLSSPLFPRSLHA